MAREPAGDCLGASRLCRLRLDGHTGSGVVSSAKLSGSEPTLKVGNTDVPLSSVTEVRSSAG